MSWVQWNIWDELVWTKFDQFWRWFEVIIWDIWKIIFIHIYWIWRIICLYFGDNESSCNKWQWNQFNTRHEIGSMHIAQQDINCVCANLFSFISISIHTVYLFIKEINCISFRLWHFIHIIECSLARECMDSKCTDDYERALLASEQYTSECSDYSGYVSSHQIVPSMRPSVYTMFLSPVQ